MNTLIDVAQKQKIAQALAAQRGLSQPQIAPGILDALTGGGYRSAPKPDPDQFLPAPDEDPRGMFWQEDSFLPQDNPVRVADSGAVASDAAPTPEELAEVGQRIGIAPEALQGLSLNATEARNFGYLLRMMEAEKTVRDLEGSNTLGQRMLELLPGKDIESMLMDPDYRRYTLARENFNEAALRAATGATINDQELPMQRQNYFPLPTDDEETRQLLQRQRQALMMSLTAGSGPGAAIIPEYGQPVVPQSAPKKNLGELSDEDILKALTGG